MPSVWSQKPSLFFEVGGKTPTRSHLQGEQRCQTHLNEGGRDNNTETYMEVYGFLTPPQINKNDLCGGDDKHTQFGNLAGGETEAVTNRKANKAHATFPSMIMLNNSLPCT